MALLGTAAQSEQYLRLSSVEEVKLLLDGLNLIKDNKTVVLQDLKRKVTATGRYFKLLSGTDVIKAAAEKRNLQRRRDGRG